MKHVTLSETREKIKAGVDKLADVVKITLGAKGRNVILNDGFRPVQIINDGVTIAREVELPDDIENTGAILAKRAAEKTNDEAGDGTTTTIVLLQAFLSEMMKIKTDDPRGLREKIKLELDKVIAEIDKNKRECTEEDIYKIAKNSSLDANIAKTLSELIKEVGRDGVISIEDSQVPEIKYEVVKGVKIDDGYASPYFINNMGNLRAELKDIPVLLTTRRISAIPDILPLVEDLQRKGFNSLAVFCHEITDDMLGFFVTNKLKNVFNFLVVKTRNLDDLEVITGAKIISEENQEKYVADNVGAAAKIECGRFHTTVLGNSEVTQEEIDKQVATLREQLKNLESDYEKEQTQRRIARLIGGVAVIKIGGENEEETKEKKLKLEDSLNSVKAAMEDGIVEGGGMALIRAALTLNTKTSEGKLVCDVIQRPFTQIVQNAEEKEKKIDHDIKEVLYQDREAEVKRGYNVITRKWEDLFESGIIDPAKVVKCSLKNAFAMGNQILTADASVIIKKEKDGRIAR